MVYNAPIPFSPPVASANYANSAGSANTANYANTAGYAETGGLPSISNLQAAHPIYPNNNWQNPTNYYVVYIEYCEEYGDGQNHYTTTYFTRTVVAGPYGYISNEGPDFYCQEPTPISVFSSN